MKLVSNASSGSPTAVRLLKVVTNFSSGGTEGQVHALSQGLDRKIFDFQFACLKEYGPFLKDLKQADISVREFPIGSFYQFRTYMQILKLANFMRRERIQICHSYNFYSNLIAVPAARLAGVPVVLASIRDRGVYLTAMQKKVQCWTCKFADRVLVNADAIRIWLIDQGVEDGKINLLKNGIDMRPYRNLPSNSDIRKELDIPGNSKLIVLLARLNAQKGIVEFLNAAKQVKKRHPDAYFLIVGEKLEFKKGVIFKDAEYHEYLQNLSETLGVSAFVRFTGHRTDVASLLSQSYLSVLPSHSEGLSNSLIESMAAGLPIVATDVGGNPELVKHGVNGLLVPVKDISALVSAINTILDDPDLASQYGKASFQFCAEHFSISKMIDKTQNLYLTEIRKHHRESIASSQH